MTREERIENLCLEILRIRPTHETEERISIILASCKTSEIIPALEEFLRTLKK